MTLLDATRKAILEPGGYEKYKMEPTNLAVNTSFPRRANRPSPSDDALHCEAQMSPSARMLCQGKHLKLRNTEKGKG